MQNVKYAWILTFYYFSDFLIQEKQFYLKKTYKKRKKVNNLNVNVNLKNVKKRKCRNVK